MLTLKTNYDREQYEQIISRSTAAGAGKMRYAAAMYFYQRGEISDRELEIYRTLAKEDHSIPTLEHNIK